MTFAEERHKQYFNWAVSGAGTAGSNADVANTTSRQLTNKETNSLGIYSAVEIYFSFSPTAQNINKTNDLILPANTLTFITVPKGARTGGQNIYHKGNATAIFFNFLSTTTTTGSVRLVEC